MAHFSCLALKWDAEHRAQKSCSSLGSSSLRAGHGAGIVPTRGGFFVGLRHICHASINPTNSPDSQHKELSCLSDPQLFKCCSFFHTTWGHGSLARQRVWVEKDQALLLILNSTRDTHTHTKKTPTKPPVPCSKPSSQLLLSLCTFLFTIH